MQPAAAHLDQPDVAFDHDRLCQRRNAGKAQTRRRFAGVHHAALRQRRLFRMLHDEEAEGAGIVERAAHDHGVGDGMHAIGEGDGAGLRQHAHFGEFRALHALGHGAVAVDLGEAVLACASGDELDRRHVVDDRLCVGQADHRGDAAGNRGASRRGQCFLMFETGLAGMHADVDQAGGETGPLAVDHLGALGFTLGEEAGAGLDDLFAVGQHAARRVDAAGRVEQARVDVGRQRRAVVGDGHVRGSSIRAGRGSRSESRGRPCARRRPFRPARG